MADARNPNVQSSATLPTKDSRQVITISVDWRFADGYVRPNCRKIMISKQEAVALIGELAEVIADGRSCTIEL